MKWCTYRVPGAASWRVGVVSGSGNEIHGLAAGTTLLDLLERGTLDEAGREALSRPVEVVQVCEVELAPPVPRPPSFRDFMSFERHLVNAALGMGVEVPEVWYQRPVFYFSNPAAMLGPTQPVRRPPGVQALDFELEVAAVVGKEGSDLDAEQAATHIAGYMVLCDWSARDVQSEEIPLTMGPFKSKDFASSVSGYLVTPDEFADLLGGGDPTTTPELRMTASVNGVVYSEGLLSDMHWTFAEMIAEASRNTTVRPGDVIGSGTVGKGCILELASVHGPTAYPYLQPGDRVVLEVERIGRIDTSVVGA